MEPGGTKEKPKELEIWNMLQQSPWNGDSDAAKIILIDPHPKGIFKKQKWLFLKQNQWRTVFLHLEMSLSQSKQSNFHLLECVPHFFGNLEFLQFFCPNFGVLGGWLFSNRAPLATASDRFKKIVKIPNFQKSMDTLPKIKITFLDCEGLISRCKNTVLHWFFFWKNHFCFLKIPFECWSIKIIFAPSESPFQGDCWSMFQISSSLGFSLVPPGSIETREQK